MTYHQLSQEHEKIIEDFHILFTETTAASTWSNTFYRGVALSKCAFDLWIYQEIIWQTQPDVIIETGTYRGGSALYMADLLAILPPGEFNRRVITVDVRDEEITPEARNHPRISFVKGHSLEMAEHVRIALPSEKCKIMAVLDSAHDKHHVLEEMRLYGSFVSPGQYLIVEDTNVHGHPALKFPRHGPGPWEAVEEFMAGPEGEDFEIDLWREKFMMTFNPRGYLKKK